MLNLRLLVVGKLKESWWRDAESEFLKRLSPFARIKIEEMSPEAITASVTAAQSMTREGERLRNRLTSDDYVVALDRTGQRLSSIGLAELLRERSDRPVTFVMGGTAGLTKDVLQLAQKTVSLSDLTFTHEMARVILLEQLYRATTILIGKKYHN